MTSRLVTAMDDIAELWTALTPPTDTQIRYRRIKHAENIGRRAFFFGLAEAVSEAEFGAQFALVRYEFRAVVRMDMTGLDLVSGVNAVANERSLLEGAIRFASSWSAGVRAVIVRGSRTVPQDTGDIDIEISIVALCEESDGT